MDVVVVRVVVEEAGGMTTTTTIAMKILMVGQVMAVVVAEVVGQPAKIRGQQVNLVAPAVQQVHDRHLHHQHPRIFLVSVFDIYST